MTVDDSRQPSLFDADLPTDPPTIPELPDGEARAYAIDPSHNVVLEASAGTGKTAVLVSRYVNLLRAGVTPVNILAITFTRKAAAEMRQRIVRELRAGAARSAADRKLWLSVRDRLDDVSIGTIDAFCYSLLREFPLEAGLDPGFSIADETEVARLVDQALDGTLRWAAGQARRNSDLALLLAHVPLMRLKGGLAHLLDRRIVAHAALDRYLGGAHGEIRAEEASAALASRTLAAFDGQPGGLERFVATGPVGRRRFDLLAADLRALRSGALTEPARIRQPLDALRRHLFTKEGNARRQFPRGYTQHDCASVDLARAHVALMQALAPEVGRALDLYARDVNLIMARAVRQVFAVALRRYREALDDHDVLDFTETLERAVRLLRQMDEFARSRYRLESRYHHVLVDELQDTSRLQWELVSELVRSWGEGFGLVHDAPVAPTVFVVGDRKQSIYRFRDADVSIVEDVAREIAGIRQEASVTRAITHSFRAVPTLLAFVNDLFSEVGGPPSRDDSFRYDHHDAFPLPSDDTQDARLESAGALGVIANADATALARATAAEIVRLCAEGEVRDPDTGVRRRVQPADIAILFRSRESHREFEAALDEAGIPTYVYKGLGFFDSDEIKDLGALLRFFAAPESNLRAAAFLRSRFVQLSDRGLRTLAPDLASAVLGPAPAAWAALSQADSAVLGLVRRVAPGWFAQADRVPPSELLDRVLAESGYYYEIRGARRAQAHENIKKFRGLVRRIENRGYVTLARIADHLERLSAGDESNAMIDALRAVSLMTVHAAKGLEFPIVFLVNIARGTGGLPPAIRVVTDGGGGQPTVSVAGYRSEADEVERAREREETKRLLYVAVTRARDRLYLASLVSESGQFKPGPGSLGAVLPPSFAATFEQAARESSPATWTTSDGRGWHFRVCGPGSPAPGASGPPLPFDQVPFGADLSRLETAGEGSHVTVTEWLDVAHPARAAGSSVRRDLGRLAGGLAHSLVVRAALAGQEDGTEPGSRELQPLAWLEAEEQHLVVERARAMARVLVQRIRELARGDPASFEVPFSIRGDAVGLGRETAPTPNDPPRSVPARIVRGTIDCVIDRDGGPVVVLELKTGEAQPRDRQQLEIYMAAARVLYPGRHVEGHLVYSE